MLLRLLNKILRKNYINTIYNLSILKYRKVKYDRTLKIYGKIYCVASREGNVIIGKNVKIKSSLKSNPIGGQSRTILFARENASITIGNNTGISNSAIVAHSSISIGNNVLIGGGTKIYDTDFHSINFKERGKKNESIKTAPIIIRDNVFIGAHTIILKGVTIGEGAVIGAGSVITHNVPAMEVWAGNPAKYIKTIIQNNGERYNEN